MEQVKPDQLQPFTAEATAERSSASVCRVEQNSAQDVLLPYRKDIDGLRAIAVLSVVLFHAKVPGFAGGFIGVDVFFVISGFLITRMMVDDFRAGQLSLASFYVRRIRRIVPALLCVYLGCTLLASLLMLPSDMAEFGRSLASSALFVSNVFFYSLTDYFGGPADLKPLLHTWSLSIEEQYYLLWPLVFLLISSRSFNLLLPIACIAGLVSLIGMIAAFGNHPEAAFFMAPFRVWELMLGAAIALLPAHRLPAFARTEVAGWTGLFLIGATVLLLHENTSIRGLATIPACLGSALLIASGTNGHLTVARLLSIRPLVGIGLISYSLYLWHWPLLSFARYHLDRSLLVFETGALLGCSAIVAFLSYRCVEQPARRLSVRNARPVIGVGVAFLGAFALLGHQINEHDGWTFNLHPEIRHLDALARTENVHRRNCMGAENLFGNDEACAFGTPRSGSFDVVVFGDSHGDHYTPAISLLASAAGLSGRQITMGGCLALLGNYDIASHSAVKSNCRVLREAVVRFVDANPGLKLAVLAHAWSSYSGAPHLNDKRRPPFFLVASENEARSEQRTRDLMRASLQLTLDFFERRGIQVLLLGQVPPLGKERPLRCLATAIKRNQPPHDCGRPVQEVQQRLNFVNSLLSELAEQRDYVTFFSPLDVMCDTVLCRPELDGLYMYRDGSHLNRLGAERLSREIRLPAVPR